MTKCADGTELLGSLYLPIPLEAHEIPNDPSSMPSLEDFLTKNQHPRFPCIVIRSPYGRKAIGTELAWVFACRGFAVLMQDTRGRFGSSGEFFPIKDEMLDGGDTLEWVQDQSWCDGNVGCMGVSYLGLTSYAALGTEKGRKHCRAIVPVLASSTTHEIIYHDGGPVLALDLVMRWLYLVVGLMNGSRFGKLGSLRFFLPKLQWELDRALLEKPVGAQDLPTCGKKLDYFQDVLRHTRKTDAFWQDKNKLCDLVHAKDRPAVHIIAGWYDFFCKASFKDFLNAEQPENARDRERSTMEITVGPWHHWESGGRDGYFSVSMNVTIDFMDTHLKNMEAHKQDQPIHCCLLGSQPLEWLGLSSWPPPREFVHRLDFDQMHCNSAKAFSSYTFDPENPTPAVGGRSFDPNNTGAVNQNDYLKRNDLAVFTSDPLINTIDIVGNVHAILHVKSSNPFTDFFVKICDLDIQQHTSLNRVENLVRVSPEMWDSFATNPGDGSSIINLNLGPIAMRFNRGHKIQVVVAAGAHPLYCRNYGTGEVDLANATEMRPATHTVFHSSHILLPSDQPLVFLD